MTATKRQVLEILYKDFYTEINQYVDITSIFPDYRLVDIEDIIFYINYYFSSNKYQEVIVDLLSINKIQVNNITLKLIVEVVSLFLEKFKKI